MEKVSFKLSSVKSFEIIGEELVIQFKKIDSAEDLFLKFEYLSYEEENALTAIFYVNQVLKFSFDEIFSSSYEFVNIAIEQAALDTKFLAASEYLILGQLDLTKEVFEKLSKEWLKS